MNKRTFTIFTNENKVWAYLFDTTREEAQEIVKNMNNAEPYRYYYMDGYYEDRMPMTPISI